MSKKQRLELTWIGKDENQINPEPRILIENAEYSYSKAEQGQLALLALEEAENNPTYDNMIIHGDNLLALKALELEYAGKVKCIYIDPPYNTGSAFEHYDDNLEHSTWLSLMKPRLELLRNLLSEDGSIWISIDSYESHYLKVLCDEVFGRINFIDEVIWQRAYAPVNLKKTLSKSHDTILVYAKNFTPGFELNRLPRGKDADSRYKNPDNDPRGPWKSSDLSVGPIVKDKVYTIITPSGRKVLPPEGRCWVLTKDRYDEYLQDNRIWFGDKGQSVPSIKRFLSEVKDGVVAQTLWTYQEVGHTQDAKKEVKKFNSDNVFDTPKPERLIERVLTLGSNPGDLVLDSFLGSGTTAAVAHKMGRRYIGIELGEHAYTHCVPRLKAVVDGEQGGISKAVKWQGGGGFKFYELAPSLIQKDNYGNLVISKEYNADMLAAAMAKHEGYTYSPNPDVFWKQGYSGDSNYIFTTTGTLTTEYLEYILTELKEDEHLLICAKSFDKECTSYNKNIIIRKIPKVLLGKCEFGVENYNLNIIESENLEWEAENDE